MSFDPSGFTWRFEARRADIENQAAMTPPGERASTMALAD